MSWPAADINTTNLDDGASDKPKDARADLLAAVVALNAIIAARGATGGIAPLNASGLIPATYFSGASILAKLLPFDGPASGLDADLLDGLQGAAYPLLDGSRAWDMAAGATLGQVLRLTVASSIPFTAQPATVGSFALASTGTGVLAGFGPCVLMRAENGAGNEVSAASLSAIWTDPTNASEDAYLAVGAAEAGTVTEQMRLEAGHLRMREISTPANSPSGTWYGYFKSTGFFVRGPSGAEVGPMGGAGSSDHGTLSGLSDDDHPQYLPVNGSRSMAADFNLGQHSIIATELAGNPSTPSTGQWKTFFKAAGLFVIDDAGAVTGPFVTGGVTDHGALTGLSDDDHSQYLLRQPAAAVVINNSAGDFDFTVKGNGIANFFVLDAGLGVAYISASGTPHGRLHVATSSHTLAGTYAECSGAAPAVWGKSTATGPGIYGYAADAASAGVFTRSATVDRAVPVLDVFETTSGSGVPGPTLRVWQQCTADLAVFLTGGGGSEIFGVGQSEITFNEAGLGVDVRMEGAGEPYLFFLDHITNTISMGAALTAQARVNIKGNGLQGLFVESDHAAGIGIATNVGTAVDAMITGVGVAIQGGSADESSSAAYFYRDAVTSSPLPLVDAELLNASDVGTVYYGFTVGSGSLLTLDQGTMGNTVFEVLNTGTLRWKNQNNAGYHTLDVYAEGMALTDNGGTRSVPAVDMSSAVDRKGMAVTWGVWPTTGPGAPWKLAAPRRLSAVDLEDYAYNRLGESPDLIVDLGGSVVQRTRSISTTVTLSGASMNAIQIPQGSLRCRVVTKNVTDITGCTGYDCGITSDTDRFGVDATIGETQSTDNPPVWSPSYTASPPDVLVDTEYVVLTAKGGTFTGGQVLVVLTYELMTLAESFDP